MRLFLLQIVRAETGEVVRFPGGGPLERDLIDACTEAIVSRGVGMWRTEAHVREAIAAGMTEAIMSLKRDTRQVI